ncbi:hypothetical protein SEEN2TTA_04025, partial [Salmonella enterica subsp. enterica serovar Newport str. Pond080-2TTA]
QNTTQEGGKTDHNKVVINKINKYSAGDTIEGNAAGTAEKSAMTHRNGKVHFMQDIRDLFTAMSQRKSSRKENNIKKSTLEQNKKEKYKKEQTTLPATQCRKRLITLATRKLTVRQIRTGRSVRA